MELKPLTRRWLVMWACTFGLCLGSVLLMGMGMHAALSQDDREQAERIFAATGQLFALMVLGALVATGMLARWITDRYFVPLARAAEQTRLIATAHPGARLAESGPRELRALAQAANALAEAFQRMTEEDAERIREARADLDGERRRLAALMSELTQGVVLCTADGRILLYNESARSLLSAPDAQRADGSSTSGYIGIGRSLYSLMHKESVEHALARLRSRIAAGAGESVTTFATSIPNGSILRARIAPVAAAAGSDDGSSGGFVLLLEDLSRELSELEHRDALLSALVEQTRGTLGSLRAATENLASQSDMPAPMRLRFLAIAQDELLRLTRLVERTGSEHTARMNRRPDLEPMRVAELIEVIAERLHAIPAVAVTRAPVDSSSWVQVDSYAMMQAVRYLVRRLLQRRSGLELTLHATSAGEFVYLDLDWRGEAIAAATVLEWETAPLSSAGEPSALTLREVIARNRAELWHETHTDEGRPFFRIMLRSVAAEPPDRSRAGRGRPVYYDFDLLRQSDENRAFDELPLSALAYTAFDTETTGLEPSAGDEIVAIGAVRIVNGRLLRAETFDQLIDPKRSIDPEAVKIHGIRSSMLSGQPHIGSALPAFHRFCEDTVLVGHNAAFDLRFFQLKETVTGVRFSHPVLDTLLLSALIHEALNDHRLEAIAQRMGVDVIGRHTALGDAILTGEVFLRMLPLLASQGITTLRQAREAQERTYYAKLRY